MKALYILFLFSFLFAFAQVHSEESSRYEFTGWARSFKMLARSDSFVYTFTTDYKKCEIFAFDISQSKLGEIKPVSQVSFPHFPSSAAVIDNTLYLTNSNGLFKLAAEAKKVEFVKAFDGAISISNQKLIAIANLNKLTVRDLAYKEIVSIELPVSVNRKTTRILWVGKTGVLIHDRVSKALISADILSQHFREYQGINLVNVSGDLVLISLKSGEHEAENVKAGLDRNPFLLIDGKLVRYESKLQDLYEQGFMSQSGVMRLRLGDNRVQYYRNDELLFERFGPLYQRYMFRNLVVPRDIDADILFIDDLILFRDLFSDKFFVRPILEDAKSKYLPLSPMVTADLEVRSDGTLAMLFANGCWMKVSVPDWKPVKAVTHHNLAGNISTATPQGKYHILTDNEELLAIDDSGSLERSSLYFQTSTNRMDRFIIEQGGTHAAHIRIMERLTWTKGMKAELSARIYRLDNWHSDKTGVVEIGKTSRYKYKDQETPNSWRVMNFVGKTGTFVANVNDKFEIIPKRPDEIFEPRCDPGSFCNFVWACGMKVTRDKVFLDMDSKEIKVKIPGKGRDWFVPAWELPGTKCGLFLQKGGWTAEDRLCAIHKSPRNEQERIMWLDIPKGTRWVSRYKKSILCISSYGWLLGQVKLPEWMLEETKSKDAGM